MKRGRPPKVRPLTESSESTPMAETPVREDSPEFQAAVSAVVAKTLPALREMLLNELSANRDEAISPGSDRGFAEGLAMAIAELTDQTSGMRKRLSPQVIRQREMAREKMTDLILKHRANGVLPTYQLTNKVYLDEVLVDPIWMDPNTRSPRPTEVDWPGVPNEAMIPLNDAAKEIFAAFKDSIGTVDNKGLPPPDRLGITPKGLVVKNGAVQHRRELPAGFGAPVSQFGEGLSLKHKGVPGTYTEVHVLGTVAPAARQTV